MADVVSRPEKDLAAQRSGLILWGVPLAVVLVTALVDVGHSARTILWTVSLLIAGIACVANARRSARLHCYITGPFFLLLAGSSFVHGSGVLPLGAWGWTAIAAVLLVGAPSLIWGPELIWGKYAGGSRTDCC
jgi:hypothetical protein